MDDDPIDTVLKRITYGMYLLTAHGEDGDYAAGTVNWLSQASFEPPLVMVGVKKDSTSADMIDATGEFAVNVLENDQQEMAAEFFAPSEVEGNTINGHEFRTGSTGCPVFVEVGSYLECEEVGRVEHGDHTVVVGEVVDARADAEGFEALDMWNTDWTYGGTR